MMKNKKMSILAVLVMLVVVTAYSVSGTYAKYTSTFTGKTSTATIAKWAFEIGDAAGNYVTAANDFKFDLFETITETDGSMDTEVANNGTKNTVIAPGTKGTFTIKLKNNSEVKASYVAEFTPTVNGLPINFKVNDVAATLTDGKFTVASTENLDMNGNGEADIKVDWEWPFVTDGVDDTTFASTATDAKTVSVDAKIIVNQVD